MKIQAHGEAVGLERAGAESCPFRRMRYKASIVVFMACAMILYPMLCMSQDLSPAQFDATLKACAQSQNTALNAALEKEINDLYSDQSARSAITNVGAFILKLPESDRADAFKLYTPCVAPFFKPVVVQGPIAPPTAPTVVYKVCSGEYERACPAHDAYLYCYSDLGTWAAARCTSFTTSRVTSFGGNKCGYSLDTVVCNGPK
jgi:hypothetical protein